MRLKKNREERANKREKELWGSVCKERGGQKRIRVVYIALEKTQWSSISLYYTVRQTLQSKTILLATYDAYEVKS